jgi:cobalt/nickel transport protein
MKQDLLSKQQTPTENQTSWEGVDKTVVEKFAAAAGHPAREPYINTEQGDLLLFLFLLAGAIGGFVMGCAYRTIFPPRKAASKEELKP